MDSDQDRLDAYNARTEALEAAEWKRKKVAHERYEGAAKLAHKIRMTNGLICGLPVISWDEMGLGSQRHLIAAAEIVDKTPSVTATELETMYKNRLRAWGDSENPDLAPWSEDTRRVEELVLQILKATLADAAA